MQKSSRAIKTIVEIPAGGFYVHDTTDTNIIPYSDGAFGCCYLTIEDQISKKTLIAHINAQVVMFEPIADKTVKGMLKEFAKQGGDIAKSTVTIVHSNKFEEYEQAQSEKTENYKLTNSYKEKTKDNMVMEPFANEFLEKTLNRADVQNIIINDKFNSNLVEFIQNPVVGTKKTDICFIDGKVHLQNLLKSEVKEQTPNAKEAFTKVDLMQKNGTATTISAGDWRSVHNFYIGLREGLDTGQIKQDGVRFDFSDTATKEFKEKMNSPQLECVNMNQAVKQKLQEHIKQPTLISLIRAGLEDKALSLASNMKSQQSFVEALKKLGGKEDEGTGKSK